MTTIEVRTQAALDKALAKVKPGDIIALISNGYFDVYGAATVRASIEDVRVPLADEDHGKVKVRRVSDIAECDIHGRAL